MNYLLPIKMAIIVFPLIAFLFTIPFILQQYHKYGSIHKFRVCIIYSFILYLITIYFLVILPLPKIEDVVYQEGMIRLVPFTFISDFIRETSFVLTEPSTYLQALKEPCFYTVAFNILMTVPFGMYLRYYFKCNGEKVMISTFLLSLFFELTQLTGLYFIYPYPYRFFDVDDLLMNTLGGVLGYFVVGVFVKFLPTREEIDHISLEKGKEVSGLRKLTVFFLDFFLYLLFVFLLKRPFPNRFIEIIVFVIYYIIIPYLFSGKTVGGGFLNVRLEFLNYRFLRLTTRILFLYFYYFYFPYFLLKAFMVKGTIGPLMIFPALLFFYPIHLFLILKEKRMYYDSLFKVNYQSTISE